MYGIINSGWYKDVVLDCHKSTDNIFVKFFFQLCIEMYPIKTFGLHLGFARHPRKPILFLIRGQSWVFCSFEYNKLQQAFFLLLARDWSSGLASRPLIGRERPSSRLRLHQQCSEGKHRASRMLILVNIREQFSNGFNQLLSCAFLRGGQSTKQTTWNHELLAYLKMIWIKLSF